MTSYVIGIFLSNKGLPCSQGELPSTSSSARYTKNKKILHHFLLFRELWLIPESKQNTIQIFNHKSIFWFCSPRGCLRFYYAELDISRKHFFFLLSKVEMRKWLEDLHAWCQKSVKLWVSICTSCIVYYNSSLLLTFCYILATLNTLTMKQVFMVVFSLFFLLLDTWVLNDLSVCMLGTLSNCGSKCRSTWAGRCSIEVSSLVLWHFYNQNALGNWCTTRLIMIEY